MLIRKPIFAAMAALALFPLASCSRKVATEDVRLLLLPFENETSSASLHWQTPVSSAVLEYDLNALPHWTVFRGESVRNIVESQANRVLQGYFTLEGGKLALHAWLLAPLERKTLRVMVREGPPSEGIQPLLDALAKDLNPAARSFSSQDPGALRSYGEALETTDQATRIRLLQTATLQDPKLSAAGISLAEALLAQGDRPGAAEAARRGARSASHPTDRARLEYLAATAREDDPGREKALQTLANLAPSVNTFDQLGQLHTRSRQYQAAIQDYEAVTRLEKNAGGAYNFIGYLYAYRHDLDRAKKNFEQYAKLAAPNDPNPLDSMGEAHFLLGEFALAEKFFNESYAKNRSPANARELGKAATAHLLTGDVPGASAAFEKYLEAAKSPDPQASEIPRGQWEFFSGKRRLAMERLEKLLTSQNADTSAVAGAQLAFWRLLTGDRHAALAYAAAARNRAASPMATQFAAVSQYLASPSGAAPNALIQGLALVLQHQFAPAAAILERVYRETPPANDGDARALLAWMEIETGKPAAARPLVDLYPLIFPVPDNPFSALTFPRFLRARAEVLKSAHQEAEASRLRQLADQLAGGVPERFE